MAREVWVVVPFTRPHLAAQLTDYFLRQSLPNAKLLIVTGTDRHPSADHVIRIGEMRQGEARNVGMDYLRTVGAEVVSFWDDDDHYGPGYLEEQLEHIRPGRVVGKLFGFVEFNAGMAYFDARRLVPTTGLLIGGTIAGILREMPPWKDQRIGEDGAFSMDCRARRLETFLLSEQHWVYSRTGELRSHTFRASDKGIWSVAGGRGRACALTREQCILGSAPVPDGPRLKWKEWLEIHGG